MSKLAVLLALYAAGVATWLLVDRPRGAAEPAAAPRTDAGSPDLRKVMHEARALLRSEVKDTLRNVDWRLSRMDALHASIEDALTTAQRTAEGAGQANYGKLEALEEALKGLGQAGARLAALQTSLAALEKRLAAVEARPPQVIREIVSGEAKPPTPAAPGPVRPRLPTGPQRDPAVVAAEIAKAREDLKSDVLETLFPAIEKVREHRVMEEVPRLIEILANFKDEFGRAAAAAALGKMQAADAVPALAEALVDKSDLVAQQANKAVLDITGFDTHLEPTAGIRTRRTTRGKIKEWWRAHEQEVRERLARELEGP